jgi:8-oxo-dGTP pyrophosphatase MutT (NUDIX family)
MSGTPEQTTIGGQTVIRELVLAHEVNRFNGIEIEPDSLPQDSEDFRRRLVHSLGDWQQNGHALVWLNLPIERSRLIAPATECGFTFHHTTDRSLTLTYKLDPDAAAPSFATHFIGAGGVVLNSCQEVLVVNERHRRDQSRPYYKLPGGALHPGEHLIDAVIREVFEETGVHAAFEALVCFRHWHGYRWNKSDIYFICRLSARSDNITVQASEIEEAQWMRADAYLTSEYVSAFNKRVVRAALESPGISPEVIDGYADPDRYEFFMPAGAGASLPQTLNP